MKQAGESERTWVRRKMSRKMRFRLSLMFALVEFIIMLLTALFMGLLAWIAIRTGAVNLYGKFGVFLPLLAFLIISVLMGTLISLCVGHRPMRPLHEVIDATNALAKGDFSARLNLQHPPALHELSDSFNRMAQELGSTEMLRTDFVNNFSHEFKTPIVSIKGFAEMLKYDDLSKEQREEYLDIIISESGRLAALATNVLNLSKVENQKILTGQAPFDLTEQVRRCVLLMEKRWEEKRIEMTIDLDEVTYNGNAEQLSQVWVNLLDNAVKFTPEGGRIAISLLKGSEKVTLSVADSGCGITSTAAAHVFDKFYQGDTSHAAKGNGLGLTLAQRVVQLHGGDILCESREGLGTKFTVALPLPTSAA